MISEDQISIKQQRNEFDHVSIANIKRKIRRSSIFRSSIFPISNEISVFSFCSIIQPLSSLRFLKQKSSLWELVRFPTPKTVHVSTNLSSRRNLNYHVDPELTDRILNESY